jgi:hypothetical protein
VEGATHLVEVEPKKITMNISERMKSGELAHEEEPSVIQAKKLVTENASAHYEAILKQAGVELPYSGDHGDDDGDDSADGSDNNDNDVAEGVPSPQANTVAANHTLTQTDMNRHEQTQTDSNGHKQSTHMEETRKETQTDTEEPSDETRTDTDKSQKKQKENTLPPPLVTTIVPKKKVSISERMKSGEITLEEKPDVIQAKKVLTEKFTDTQAHDPNMVQLPEGGWGRLVQKRGGGYMVLPVEESPASVEADDEFETAINTVTREELKVTALSIMKKVAMSPSTVMGFAYLQSMKTDEGAPYFEGDIGDFLNYCVKFTLKYGYGAELAIMTGKPTLSDVFKANAEANN